ncbi:MAG: 16S rRNA (guanine(966)-N(2))-methyltransferase RsmD [Peptococcia bacterium]
MRIIAGTAKGHTIKSLKGLATRPTPERVREAIFNILGVKIINARFLDLFAGSGAVGLEALSRGAAYCCFNDKNKAVCRIIKENLTKCAFEQSALVYNKDVFAFISDFTKKNVISFDIIYADPPYKVDFYDLLLQKLVEAEFLADEGIIIMETDKRTFLQEQYFSGRKEGAVLKLFKKSKYGDTVIWFYKLWGRNKSGNHAFVGRI